MGVVASMMVAKRNRCSQHSRVVATRRSQQEGSMVVQTRPRFIRAVLGCTVVAATLSCAGSGRRNYTRLGDDLIVSGGAALYSGDSVSGDVIVVGREVNVNTGV